MSKHTTPARPYAECHALTSMLCTHAIYALAAIHSAKALILLCKHMSPSIKVTLKQKAVMIAAALLAQEV